MPMIGDPTQNQPTPFGGTGEWSQITQSGAGKFPNPFWDIASEYVPRNLQQVFEWCMPAGAAITLDSYGNTKPIESIRVGDIVLTKTCELKPVKAIGNRKVNEDIAVIKASGLTDLPLRLTKNHKVYCWKPTSTLKSNRLNFDKAKLEKAQAGDIKTGDWLVTPLPVYEANCSPIDALSENIIKAGGYAWRKVLEVTYEHFEGLVYNFEVDDIEHNYIANNILVSNCEYIYMTYGTLRSASRKVVRYFLTELVLEGGNQEEVDKYEELLNKKLHLITQLAEIGDDYAVYGNCFISVYFPFDRFLICPKCHTHYHIDTIAYKFQFKSLAFDAVCPKCDYQGTFEREDMRSPDTSRTKLIRWNPKRMRLRYHDISGEIEYFFELEPRFLDKIRNGNRFYLNKTPWSIIECAARTPLSDQPLYKFERDQLYHMHEATLAGLPIRGWGIPPILPNFKLAYYIQVLRRYDEAIALDYIIPFRILFPQQSQAAGQDPLQMLSMDVFISHMKDMVAAKRANATDIQITPFPIGYEMLGGEGRTLSPKDNIAQAMDEMLNAIGYPAELYRGSLAIQAFPVALRLFEKTWGTLVDGYNDLVDWVLKKLSRYYGWAPIEGSLRSVTLADDIERKALQLQAAAGMDISKATAFRPLGLDFMEEQKKVIEEQKEIMKLQQEAMEEQEVSQIGTGDPNAQQGGAMPTGPGGSPGATPGDVSQQAKDIAYQLVIQTPEPARRGQLIKIKQSNPTLHALVLQEMDNLRGQLASQGQTMMMQQMKTGSANDIDKLPSPMLLGLLIANQVLDYNRGDMQKLAMAIKYATPDLAVAYQATDRYPALQAFKYVYGKRMGWL